MTCASPRSRSSTSRSRTAKWCSSARGSRFRSSTTPATDVHGGGARHRREAGRLELAFVCERADDQWLGYAASAERHTYFRYRDNRLELIAPDDAARELEDIAFRLVEEWIWYDEEDALTERARYANYGYPVRGANLKSEKLALLRQRNEPYSTLAPEAEAVREALVAQWLKAALASPGGAR